MFTSLRTLMSNFAGEPKRQDHFGDDDYRLAAAALLIRVATVDSAMSNHKRRILHAVLKFRFGLDDPTTAGLIDKVAEADRRAVDLYHFTSQINRTLGDEGRRRLVEMMWDVIHAGGGGECADNIVWRAADLLCVSSRERIELRRRAVARAGIGNSAMAVASSVGG
jgi:uncharacterized tellurite resistance protein B-like protein